MRSAIVGCRHIPLVVAILGLLLGPSPFCRADSNLRSDTLGYFAPVDEGAQILTRRDDFIQRLSAFDRSARMKTDKPVSEKQFLEFVKANVVAWTDEEKRKVETAIDDIRPALEALPVLLPKKVHLIKTTGAEEGKAFYTRDTAIVFPQEGLAANSAVIERTICHELFHILSRENPKLRDELYELIGFHKCSEIEFPAELKSRKITNPDAPKNDHYIRLQLAGSEVFGIPILFSRTEKYDPAVGGEFFNYLEFEFLLMESKGGSAAKSSRPKLAAPQELSGFEEQVGKNTNYVIHPEEILADNFALLVLGQQDVPSPEILHKMKAILARK
jgi:hypothetical protein